MVKIIFTLEVPTIIFNVCILFVKVCCGTQPRFESVAIGHPRMQCQGAERWRISSKRIVIVPTACVGRRRRRVRRVRSPAS
jgi:hypothetical protein